MWSIVLAATFWLLPSSAAMASLRFQRPDENPNLPRPSKSTLTLWLLVAVPSAIQILNSQMLPGLRRDWPLITDGQIWRLVTSAVVQDGGPIGMLFNLFILMVVLLAVQGYWKPTSIWMLFWGGTIAANCTVGPWLAPTGAGNSMATFIVATALAVSILTHRPEHSAAVPAWAALACVGVMLAADNYHGFTSLIGIAAGFLPKLGETDRA